MTLHVALSVSLSVFSVSLLLLNRCEIGGVFRTEPQTDNSFVSCASFLHPCTYPSYASLDAKGRFTHMHPSLFVSLYASVCAVLCTSVFASLLLFLAEGQGCGLNPPLIVFSVFPSLTTLMPPHCQNTKTTDLFLACIFLR